MRHTRPVPFHPLFAPLHLTISVYSNLCYSFAIIAIYVAVCLFLQSRQSSPERERERRLEKAERKERRNAMESEEERRERKGERKRVWHVWQR